MATTPTLLWGARTRDHDNKLSQIILRCEQGVTYEELMMEIECMKRMKHPNVVGFHGYYTDVS